jgi:hypothetical protein
MDNLDLDKRQKLEEVKKLVKNDEIFNKLDDTTLMESIDAMENLSPEDVEKYKQYQQTVLSMGIPTCRIMFTTLLEKSPSEDNTIKTAFYKKIDQLTNIEKVGGMNIEYDDKDTGKKTFFYIIMNKCHKNHNLHEQFDKVKKHFDEATWTQLLKHVSMLIYLCRSIYKINMQACIDDMFNLGYDINDVEQLQIDPSNTTLYINEEWDERMGIYFMRECDFEEEREAFIKENGDLKDAADKIVSAGGDDTHNAGVVDAESVAEVDAGSVDV